MPQGLAKYHITENVRLEACSADEVGIRVLIVGEQGFSILHLYISYCK